MISAQPNASRDKADGLFRLLAVYFRRYSRDPATREQSAKLILLAAIALCAEQTSAGDTALVASEGVAELARLHRLGDK